MFTLLPALAILSALFVLAGVIQFAYRIHKYNRARSTFDLRSNGRSSPRAPRPAILVHSNLMQSDRLRGI